MFSVGVVVAFDVFEDFCLGIIGIFEATILKHFEFESSDEGFGPGVLVGVGPGRHALAQAGLGQGLAEGSASLLAAAVTVEDGAVGGTCGESLEEGVENQI